MIFAHLLGAPSCPMLPSLIACATVAMCFWMGAEERCLPYLCLQKALQEGADGTARKCKTWPLRDDWGMFREQQPVVLLVSPYQQENCQLTKLRVFPLGACFCQNLSDLWNPSSCPEYLLNQARWQGRDPDSFWCPLCCVLSFPFLLPGQGSAEAHCVSEREMLR